jgi:tRNA(Ile)-lysidine synthase TilS/MesJ
LNREFGRALVQYHMMDDGDRILVGVSGGKDSMALF